MVPGASRRPGPRLELFFIVKLLKKLSNKADVYGFGGIAGARMLREDQHSPGSRISILSLPEAQWIESLFSLAA